MVTVPSVAVSVRALCMSFGRLQALTGVDLDLSQGICTGLIGPNGSGKSTLVNCLSGLLRPTDGVVWFEHNDVTHWSMERRARCGLARNFQNLNLFENLSVRENIVAAARLAKRRDRFSEGAVLRSAMRFGLAEFLDQRVADLSWGHRRRVELARVMHGEPRYMLLDEPGAGLDLAERRKLPSVIREMSANGVGTLLVDHDVTLIGEVCQRVLVLREGRLIFDGSPAEAYQDAAVRACYLGSRHGVA